MKDEKCAHKVLKLKKKLSMDNESSKRENKAQIDLETLKKESFSSTQNCSHF